MKKILLFLCVVGMVMSINAQNPELRSTKAPKEQVLFGDVPTKTSSDNVSLSPQIEEHEINGRVATYIPIGSSGNAYGLYSNSRTYLWADPALNSVVFTHRATGGTDLNGNSRLAYDLSTDGGATWNSNNIVYTPTVPGPQYPHAAARYPQGVIVNPIGNTNPDDAWYTYLAASIINTNGIWGAYVYGVNPLTQIDPTTPTQHILESGDGIYRLIPDAMTTTQEGITWYVEPNTDYTSGTAEYMGNLIVGRGEIVDEDIVYEEELIDFLAPLDAFNDSKMAFAPDGQTGYMCFMSDVESDPVPYTSYHPVLLKTTDGGETWSDPIHVQFGGVDGIESIKYYWSDEIIESIDFYGPGFDRDEVYYNMGFSVDIIVDGDGNPHITGIIALATDEGWYPGQGTMATWHVYSDDGGNSWDATALYDNIFLEGEIGGLGMWNRPYAMSTYDGQYLAFSWIDTDLDGAEANTNPNIFVVIYNTEDKFYMDVNNVTELSLYWFSAFYGTGSQYMFGCNELNEIEFPFVFTEYTVPGDPTAEMNFIYIDGYTVPCGPTAINDNKLHTFEVEQNHPNPAVGNTSILVTSKVSGIINLRINNMLGQVMHSESINNKALGHTFEFDVSNYESGIYFYTVEIGGKSVTKKMMVR